MQEAIAIAQSLDAEADLGGEFLEHVGDRDVEGSDLGCLDDEDTVELACATYRKGNRGTKSAAPSLGVRLGESTVIEPVVDHDGLTTAPRGTGRISFAGAVSPTETA